MTKVATLEITVEGPSKEFRAQGPVKVDFDKVARSGELSDADCHTLEHGYPGAPILFMGLASSVPGGPGRFCIGIKTGKQVYPMNMFFISTALAFEAVDPLE